MIVINGVMAFTESGGRMSIRVTGYDFFSKSCYICEPISHMILLRAPQWSYGAARNPVAHVN
jgi:hypothetical protein